MPSEVNVILIRLAATTILLLAALPAAALEFGQPPGQMTCESDIHRLCEDVFPDIKRVAACLVDKRSKLTAACAEQLAHPEADEGSDEE